MRVRSVFLTGMMVLVAVGLMMCQQPEKPPAVTDDPPAATQTPPEASAGAVTAQAIAEEVRQIQTYLRNARRNVRDNNPQEGSLQLNEAASLLSGRAAEASNALQEDLEFSASEFTGMAERVFGTSAISMDEMDAALTRAYWALAAHSFRKASQQWQAGRRAQTTAYLNATATFIDESIGYYSGGLEVPLEMLVEEMRALARELRPRANDNADAVTAQMEDLGQKIEEYNRRVRQAIQENVETPS